MSKFFKHYLALILVLAGVITSCEYHVIQPEEIILSEDPVSFVTEIQPIFDAKCIACHTGMNPILVAGESWNSLYNGGYIDLDIPENSEVYIKVESTHPGGNNALSATELAIFLKWIDEGANDN
jgi:hypothetical protein